MSSLAATKSAKPTSRSGRAIHPLAAPLASSPSTKRRRPQTGDNLGPRKPPAAQEAANDVEDLQAVFGANLAAARLRIGLKQSELAAQTGSTQQYLSRIETGQKNLTLRTMVELAKRVGEEVSTLLRRPRAALKKSWSATGYLCGPSV